MRKLWLLFIWVVALAGLPSHAQAADKPDRTFTLQPTGTATVTFLAFCTEFGDKYPSQVNSPDGTIAAPEVRSALQYIAANGLAGDSATALQGQFAIWRVLKQPGPAGDATTQQVIAFAQSNTVSDPTGTSLLDAARNGQVRLTLQSWEPAGPVVQITATARDNFYGRGRLVIENISQQPLTLYMPIGTLFHPSIQAHQTMAGYLDTVSVTNPELPKTSDNSLFLLITVVVVGALILVRTARWMLNRQANLV